MSNKKERIEQRRAEKQVKKKRNRAIIGGVAAIIVSIIAILASIHPAPVVQPNLPSEFEGQYAFPTNGPNARAEISDEDFSEINVLIQNFIKNQTSCIQVRQVALRANIYGKADWNEDHRPCADVLIVVPTRVSSQAVRLAIVRKELNIVPVLSWAFSSEGVPEVRPEQIGAMEYNVLMDGLSLALLSESDQRLLLPQGMEPIYWDGLSYPSNEILSWIDKLSKEVVIYPGGVAPYYR